MNRSLLSAVRRALSLLSVSLLAKQIGLALIVVLLSLLWLQIPDASLFNVASTVVLGLLILGVAGAGEASIALGITGRPAGRKLLFKGALIFLAALILWFGWNILLEHLQSNDNFRAGYINSRFPHSLRNLFSYGHILIWFGWFWGALRWAVTGVIVASAFSFITAVQPVQNAWRTMRSLAFGVSLILAAAVITVAGSQFVSWTPGHGLRQEMISLALRLTGIILADAIAVCYFLATLSICKRDEFYNAPAGTPEDNQLRTEDNP